MIHSRSILARWLAKPRRYLVSASCFPDYDLSHTQPKDTNQGREYDVHDHSDIIFRPLLTEDFILLPPSLISCSIRSKLSPVTAESSASTLSASWFIPCLLVIRHNLILSLDQHETAISTSRCREHNCPRISRNERLSCRPIYPHSSTSTTRTRRTRWTRRTRRTRWTTRARKCEPSTHWRFVNQ